MSAHSVVAHSDYSTAELQNLMTSAQSSNSDVATADLLCLATSASSDVAPADRANSDDAIAYSWHSGFRLPPHSWPFLVSSPESVFPYKCVSRTFH